MTDTSPASHVLVPVNPTREMLEAGGALSFQDSVVLQRLNALAIYQAMVAAAAPASPQDEKLREALRDQAAKLTEMAKTDHVPALIRDSLFARVDEIRAALGADHE